MHLDIAFSASKNWIASFFTEASYFDAPKVPRTREAERILHLLLPLYHHDALRSEEHYIREIERYLTSPQNALPIRILTSFPCKSIDGLVRGACRTNEVDIRIRSTLTRIQTSNPFSLNFIPPPSNRIRPALNEMLTFSTTYLKDTQETKSQIGAALAVYIILLTIHPFRDCNGRTARYNFGATIAKCHSIAPTLLLALCLMHQAQGSSFHLACKFVRRGDFSAIFELYSECISKASLQFNDACAELADVLEKEKKDLYINLVPILMTIRSTLKTNLLY